MKKIDYLKESLVSIKISETFHADDVDYLEDALSILGFPYHHRALARGYQPVNDLRVERYSGKFGSGYIFHLPTKNSFCRGNSTHTIYYYIKE